MKIKQLPKTNKYIVLIEKDELIVDTLIKISKDKQWGMAQFTMIGAVTDVTIGYVKHGTEDYIWKNFNDQYELISANGNITWDDDTKEPLIHTHISMGDHDYNTISGHLKEAKIAVIGEVIITVVSDEKIFKTHDKKVNLKTWDI